jgi:hypothetical protein
MDAEAIADLLVEGSELRGDIADAVTDLTIEESATEITQLELTISDPGFALLGSGVLAKGSKVTYSGLDLIVAAVATDGADTEQLVVTARSRGARALQEEKGLLPGASEDASDYTTYLRHAAGRHGLGFRGQPGVQVGFTIIRAAEPGHLESTWDVGQRGAQEWGFWMFEAGGTLFFGKPTWLLAATPATLAVGWRGSAGDQNDSIEIPRCRRADGTTTTGQAEANTIEVSIDVATAAAVRPGMVLAFSGVPGFDGRYLITDNTWKPGTVEPATVVATAPIDPYIDPATLDSNSYVSEDSLFPVATTPAVTAPGGPFGPHGNVSMSELLTMAKAAAIRWPFILTTERAFGLPPYLLFAVGSKETNLSARYTQGATGDGGHGHGVWQLDNRSHQIPAGFDTDPVAQCNKAAAMLRANLDRYHDLVSALNVYNSGQTKSERTTANYGPDVAARRQALEANASRWVP